MSGKDYFSGHYCLVRQYLRRQPLDRPAAIVLLRVLEAIVQSIRAALPEFDLIRDNAITTPERG